MIGENFHYSHFWLSDFGMSMYSPEDAPQFIGREIERSNLSSIRKIPNHYAVRYTDVLTLSFLILKDAEAHASQEEFRLTGEEISRIRSWLESPKTPCPLLVIPYDSGTEVYYFGIFTSIQPFLVAQECYGLYLTFTCNAPYGFSPVITNTYEINSFVGDIRGRFFNASSEQCDYLNPVLKIYSGGVFNGTEKVTVKNVTDSCHTMELTMPEGISVLTVDCRKKSITDEKNRLISLSDIGLSLPKASDDHYISADTCIFYWLRFLYGDNHLVFSMCSPNNISKIEIKARFAVKSGGF